MFLVYPRKPANEQASVTIRQVGRQFAESPKRDPCPPEGMRQLALLSAALEAAPMKDIASNPPTDEGNLSHQTGMFTPLGKKVPILHCDVTIWGRIHQRLT